MIEQLTALLVQYGLLFVFINVFLVHAGALQVKPWRFVLYSTISAALWAGVAAGAGRMLNRQIDWALNRMDEMGANALILIAAVFVIFIAYKWWERQRFYKALRMARI